MARRAGVGLRGRSEASTSASSYPREDIDICKRLWEDDWQCPLLRAEGDVHHIGGASSETGADKSASSLPEWGD